MAPLSFYFTILPQRDSKTQAEGSNTFQVVFRDSTPYCVRELNIGHSFPGDTSVAYDGLRSPYPVSRNFSSYVPNSGTTSFVINSKAEVRERRFRVLLFLVPSEFTACDGFIAITARKIQATKFGDDKLYG